MTVYDSSLAFSNSVEISQAVNCQQFSHSPPSLWWLKLLCPEISILNSVRFWSHVKKGTKYQEIGNRLITLSRFETNVTNSMLLCTNVKYECQWLYCNVSWVSKNRAETIRNLRWNLHLQYCSRKITSLWHNFKHYSSHNKRCHGHLKVNPLGRPSPFLN